MEGAPHHRRHLVGAQDRLDALGDALVGARRLEVGPRQGVQRVAGRQHQDRNVVGAGLREAAERILGPRLRLHGDHAEAAAVAGAAVAVGRHHRAALVAKRDGADADGGDGLDNGVLGEAGQPLHPLGLENLGDIVVSVHGTQGNDPVPVRSIRPDPISHVSLAVAPPAPATTPCAPVTCRR